MTADINANNTKIVNEVKKVAEDLIPGTPAAQALEATADTILAPNVLNIAHDLAVAKSLFDLVKTTLNKLPLSNHSRILEILKAIF